MHTARPSGLSVLGQAILQALANLVDVFFIDEGQGLHIPDTIVITQFQHCAPFMPLRSSVPYSCIQSRRVFGWPWRHGPATVTQRATHKMLIMLHCFTRDNEMQLSATPKSQGSAECHGARAGHCHGSETNSLAIIRLISFSWTHGATKAMQGEGGGWSRPNAIAPSLPAAWVHRPDQIFATPAQ